ncbi:MAG: hypothetical protein H0T62_10960 [Parachlamydiaceae bacterium]|nr:hypothetical protein [Parachlamydiaceae bacterium]
MVEVLQVEVQTTTMNHHGLVAAVCNDLRLVEGINSRLLPGGPQKAGKS